jgi:sugar lactone lactonase YvrE
MKDLRRNLRARVCVAMLSLVGAFGLSAATAQIIDTVAGRSPYAESPARSALISSPWPIARSSTGAIYFSGDSEVYRYDPATLDITRVAGNGSYGYGGDGGPATTAKFRRAAGLALDKTGNLFIADLEDNRVRKVTPEGIISTIAGTGVAGYSGDGGPATKAQLYFPYYLTLDDAGTLYFADYLNGIVRKVANGIITSLPETRGSFPLALALDHAGNLYYIDDSFAHYPNDAIMKLTPSGGLVLIAVLDTNGNAEGLTLDGAGNLYTTDFYAQHVLRIAKNGVVSVIAGGGGAGFSPDGTLASAAALSEPSDVVASPGGELYFTEYLNRRVREFKPGGALETLVGAGVGDGGEARDTTFNDLVWGIATDGGGDVFVADYNRIRKVAPNDRISTVAGGTGVAVGANGDLFIADRANNLLRKVDSAGTITTIAGTGANAYNGDGGSALLADIQSPFAVAVDGAGNVYLSGVCYFAGCDDGFGFPLIRKIDGNGIITTFAGGIIAGFGGDGGPAALAYLDGPMGFAADRSGNLFIADTFNNRIRKVDTNGTITTVAGNGTPGYGGDDGPATAASLNEPTAVVVDSVGTLYIADYANNRIRKVSTRGIISTLAGNGLPGLEGDGGPAALSELRGPLTLALAGDDTLYIGDSQNYRLRRIRGLAP